MNKGLKMNRNKTAILAIILVTFIVSSCKTSRISQTQMELVQYSLKKGDLPGNWIIEGKGWGADYGGQSYGIIYTREQSVFINHIVSLHSSENRAKQAYVEWETERLNVTALPPEILYIPLDENDDYTSDCVQTSPDSPVKVCIYLQRHGRIINFVRISFDNRSGNNLTLEEVNDVLTILDKRMNEVSIDG